MTPEKFIVAFWRDNSIFPNVGNLDVERRMRTYWVCITALALSIRRYHSTSCQICVATNDAPTEEIAEILKDLKIELHNIPFQKHTTQTGSVFGAAWYLLDVISEIAERAPSDQVSIFIDPDCLVTGPLDGMISQTRRSGLLLHEIPYPKDHNANGLSRTDLREITTTLSGETARSLPIWIGGELLAGTGTALKSFVQDLEETRELIAKSSLSDRITTEEQLLSLVIDLNDTRYALASPEFASRIWTTGKYRNYSPDVISMPIWHLPAEKQRGFPKAMDFLNGKGMSPVSSDEIQDLAKLMSLRGPTIREVGYILRTAVLNMISTFSGKIVKYRRE